MPRPPKPTKGIEYVLDVRRRTDEDTGTVVTRFEVRTTREFQSFQYQLKVDAFFDAAEHTLTLKIGGVAVPADMMPGEGPAVGAYEIASLKPGTYTIIVRKAPKDVNTFIMTVTKARLTIVPSTVTGRTFLTLHES